MTFGGDFLISSCWFQKPCPSTNFFLLWMLRDQEHLAVLREWLPQRWASCWAGSLMFSEDLWLTAPIQRTQTLQAGCVDLKPASSQAMRRTQALCCLHGSAHGLLHWADRSSSSTNTLLHSYKYTSLTKSVKQKHRYQGNQDMFSPARMQLLKQLQLCTSGRYCYSDAWVSKIMKFFDN